MNADLFYTVLKQPALLNEVSEQELEQITNDYPWFGAAQFLLAIKKRKNASEGANKQLQKAALHFNHSLWMNWQMVQFEQQKTPKPILDLPADSTQTMAEELAVAEDTKESLAVANETDAMLDAEAVIEAIDEAEQQQEEPPVMNQDIKESSAVANETDAALDAEAVIEATDEAEQQQEEPSIVDQDINESSAVADETDAVPDAETAIEATDEAEQQQEGQLTNIKIDEELAHTANAIQQKTEAQHLKENDLSFTFEPYYTVDYFASQGIKLQEEKLVADKLGQQVKTFTQWLKSMKKIYVEEGKELEADKEKEVVTMATESNQKEEIITETMANVLLKQGKKEQAIELFEKLILLHPEKSGYFATQIEELKQ